MVAGLVRCGGVEPRCRVAHPGPTRSRPAGHARGAARDLPGDEPQPVRRVDRGWGPGRLGCRAAFGDRRRTRPSRRRHRRCRHGVHCVNCAEPQRCARPVCRRGRGGRRGPRHRRRHRGRLARPCAGALGAGGARRCHRRPDRAAHAAGAGPAGPGRRRSSGGRYRRSLRRGGRHVLGGGNGRCCRSTVERHPLAHRTESTAGDVAASGRGRDGGSGAGGGPSAQLAAWGGRNRGGARAGGVARFVRPSLVGTGCAQRRRRLGGRGGCDARSHDHDHPSGWRQRLGAGAQRRSSRRAPGPPCPPRCWQWSHCSVSSWP